MRIDWTSIWQPIVSAHKHRAQQSIEQMTSGRARLLTSIQFVPPRLVNSLAHCAVYSAVEEAAVRFRCPCCGYKTLEAPNALGLCPVCWWEDDGQEDADASEVRFTVNGQLSLSEARASFASIGAAHHRFLPYVRKPQLTER